MVDSFGVPRAPRIWSAGSLSLAACLSIGIGDLGAQERGPDHPAVAPHGEVASTPASGGAVMGARDPLYEALVGVGTRLDELSRLAGEVRARQDELTALRDQNRRLLGRIDVLEAERDRLPGVLRQARALTQASEAATAAIRDLVDDLLAEREQNAALRADLAEAEAERAKIENAAREKEAALSTWIAGLRDELGQREAQLANAMAARAESEARLHKRVWMADQASAEAQSQLAAMTDQLRERDRHIASMRARTEDLRRRLATASAELQHKGAENARLAAELVAARYAADSATSMVQENLATIEDQIEELHAREDAPPEQPQQLAEVLPSTAVDVLPAMPHPKPRLRADEVDAWAPAWDTADRAAAAPAAGAGGAWIPAALHTVAVSEAQPPAEPEPLFSSDGPEIPDIMSMVALAPEDSGILAPDQWSVPDWLAGPADGDEHAGLIEAAARLADGLKAAREEAVLQRQERVFTVDVAERAFAANPVATPVPLDPALDMQLYTAKSELVGTSRGGIRFYPDGSSTGGRIELQLLGDRAAVNVLWSTGAVTVERE